MSKKFCGKALVCDKEIKNWKKEILEFKEKDNDLYVELDTMLSEAYEKLKEDEIDEVNTILNDVKEKISDASDTCELNPEKNDE